MKHKRGDRGSVEENTSVAKKSNMADDSDDKSDTACCKEEEPSLREIKSMLVNIQATMATIVEENKNFRKELVDLKTAVDFNDNELRQLKKDHQKTSEMNTMLKKELEKTKKELNNTKKVLQDQEDETQNLWFSLDSLEQYTRKNSLEFHGIPECLYANAQDVVISVAKKIDVDIEEDDIEIVHKLQRKKGNKPIIAKFCSHKTKAKIYRERSKLRNVKVSDIFPHYSPADESLNRIYINENLTTFRRDLLSKALKKRKEKILSSVWTLDGKIFAKTSSDEEPIKIQSEADLNNICAEI